MALLYEYIVTLPLARLHIFRQQNNEIHRDLALKSIPFTNPSQYLMGLGSNISLVQGAHTFSMTYPRPDTS